ncbi:MAG: hypothetical protein KDC98_06490, partial [Planctomycetes bacterium]|nr:hypothetical protein [Planctomycetota bacterium]
IGEGETFLTEKDYPRAESFFHSLTNSPEADLAAAAWAGEGAAIFESTAEAKDLTDLRRAQISLAHAAVLDSGAGEASAKANYYLGQCLLALGPDHEGDNFKTRARDYFQIVASHYPTSKWAGLAKVALTQ